MGRHPDLGETLHEELGKPVVQNTLAFNRRLFLSVESRGIVLEILHQGTGFGSLVEDLGLAFVDFLATCHCNLGKMRGAQTQACALLCVSYGKAATRTSTGRSSSIAGVELVE